MSTGGMATAASPDVSPTVCEVLQRFCEARRLLQDYTTTRRELLWRMGFHYKRLDPFRRAVEKLLLGGVGTFQSCADECAYSFATAQGHDTFAHVTGAGGWMDMFQGSALEVPSRVPVWRLATDPLRTPQCARKGRQRGAMEPLPVASLDCALLSDVGCRAKRFMKAVRKLPHYQPEWEDVPEVSVVGPLRVRRGALRPEERAFDRNYSKALTTLSGRRVQVEEGEARGVALSLRRLLPQGVAALVLQFYGPTPMDFLHPPES